MNESPEPKRLNLLRTPVGDLIDVEADRVLIPWPPPPGKLVRLGDKVYVSCRRCGSVIRVNKPIFGSLHICD